MTDTQQLEKIAKHFGFRSARTLLAAYRDFSLIEDPLTSTADLVFYTQLLLRACPDKLARNSLMKDVRFVNKTVVAQDERRVERR